MSVKSILPQLSALFAAIVLTAQAQSLPGWNLVWSDEFTQADNSLPDPGKWGYDTGASGWGNNELQYYTEDRSENARIENNQLVIEARAENYRGSSYTSARLLTQGKHAWTYGRIEARIKVPRGQGIWPAFWMLGTNISSVGWPSCGEIDIMENIGREPSIVHGTVHGPGYSGGGGLSGDFTLSGGAALADDFHVFAIEREENRIRWFIDGIQYFSLTPANLPGGSAWVFNTPHFLLLNVAVGGNWPGYPDGTTVFPQRMTVDYVRVYEAENSGPPSGDLLVDPGFEITGLPNWTIDGPNVYSETATAQEGAKSLKVFGRFTGSANSSGAYQNVAVAPGQSFSAEGWLLTPANDKIAGANSAWIEVSFRDAGGAALAAYRSAAMTAASSAGSWQKFTVDTQVDPADGSVIGAVGELIAPAGAVALRKQVVFHQPAAAGGSVWYDAMSLTENLIVEPPAGTTVTVDPAETWLGYMHVSDLPADGGTYRYGTVWGTADLKASFSGATLTLGPNTIENPDAYWYIGGGAPGHPGNKIMDASMYVEKTGGLSGQTVTFTGTVTANTLTGAHSCVAYIRDFAPDYSSHTTVSVPLSSGTFSITMDTDPGAGRHVQYGFQTIGVNVWPTDAAPFGAVSVTAAVADPFAAWMAGHDFSAFPGADLSAAGDPDSDGMNNLGEFALNGDPTRSDASARMRVRTEAVEGETALLLTLPVLDGAVFSGSPAKSATVGQVSYTVEGSNGLTVFDQAVTELPASSDGMPPADSGWSYRSFRLEGAIDGATPRGPRGYLRARIESP